MSTAAVDTTQNPARIQELLSDTSDAPAAGADIVDLPGGWVDSRGAVFRVAQVRELNGLDEEAMARHANRNGQIDLGRMLDTILERGLVMIGPHKINESIRNSLLVGDKNAILLGIRISTYGADYETRISCRFCGEDSPVVFELLTDIDFTQLEDPERIYRTVKLRHGEAELRLPTVGDQALAYSDPKRTSPEANTILLGQCVRTINGQPTLGDTSMRELGLSDRKILLDYIIKTSPGPKMGEVVAECPVCKEKSDIALNMAALFL